MYDIIGCVTVLPKIKNIKINSLKKKMNKTRLILMSAKEQPAQRPFDWNHETLCQRLKLSCQIQSECS